MELADKLKKKISFVVKKKSSNEPIKDSAPDSLPDTAKDIYGDIAESSSESNADQENKEQTEEPDTPDAPPGELPEITFDQQEKTVPAKIPEVQFVEPVEVKEHEIIPKVQLNNKDVNEFENAMSGIYEDPKEEVKISDAVEKEKVNDVENVDHGFFSEFERFLEGNEVPRIADELADKDLLDKMKDYHLHKETGKPYYFHSDELKQAMKERLMQLRNLERDWFVHKEQLSQEEAMLIEKEKEISELLNELKFVMKQMKLREEFRKEVPPEDYFILPQGEALKSLSDLSASLHVMDEHVFKHHVHKKENHFASWIRNVFENDALADALQKCKTTKEMLKVFRDFGLE